jgi:hypothetical protein
LECEPFVFAGQWHPEVGPDGAVAEDFDFVDEPFEECLAGVGCAAAEDLFDLVADLGEVAGGGTLRRLVELELELGLAAAELHPHLGHSPPPFVWSAGDIPYPAGWSAPVG